MFKKLLASAGIGNATVEAVMLSPTLQAGEPFELEVTIQGGEVAQEVQGLAFAIMTGAHAQTHDGKHEFVKNVVLQEWWQELNITVQAGETLTKTFTLTLHTEIPATELMGEQIANVWLQTGLDIKYGLDGSDQEPLVILPRATQLAVLKCLNQSGYRLFKSDIEVGRAQTPDFISHLPCYQEYEFKPESRSWLGIQEIEATFVDNDNETGLLLEVDRAFQSDGYRSVSIPNHCTTVAEVKPYIQQILGRSSRARACA
ncbi:sporulation protein [Marinomonas ostreistagni]|uniref:sporulation protein n=1 Tax=Marinomonas ostreistagni TaxID=359209 RepID=UPI00194E26D4|nr:sporulation protein [Marinomonas ostreistagni]MBM6550728.1 sporulation protein [Marinomonas ostreistagni]